MTDRQPRATTAAPSAKNRRSRRRPPAEATLDAVSTLKLCDIVLGGVSIGLAGVATYLAVVGKVSVATAALLWSLPLLNGTWSQITKWQDRAAAEYIRLFVSLPIAAILYATGEGLMRRLSLPAMIMVVGIAVIGGVATRRATLGFLATALYSVALLVASAFSSIAFLDALSDAAPIALTGLIMSVISGRLGTSLEEARRKRNEANEERQRAEAALAELEGAQAQLVSTARQAGMAEIAVGVLHNVGNVLNSVNASSDSAREYLKECRLQSIEKGAKVLEAEVGRLPEFLASERGRLLPGFLVRAASHAMESFRLAELEIRRLKDNVDHIKAVVQTQQRYARVSQLVQSVRLRKLVIEAVTMCLASTGSHGIEVENYVDPELELIVDKHKLVQILLNLLSNARQASIESNGTERRIEIRAEERDDRIVIVVRDYGIGIAPETMSQLFRHGFTTKPNGHGFGLHSSANSAAEMGGRIWAESDGPGRGATFSLELPREAPSVRSPMAA